MATLTTLQATLTPQIIRLFHAAGVISGEDWAKYGEQHERHKPILDVLTQPASLSAFKDLLNAEITLKKSRSSGHESDLHHQLSAAALTTNAELGELFMRFERATPDLLDPLKRDGVLNDGTATQLEKLGKGQVGDIVAADGVHSELVHRWLEPLSANAMQQGALYLALYLARENGMVQPSEMNRLLPLIEVNELAEVRQKLVKEHGLTSERLMAEVENGMQLPQLRLQALAFNETLMALFPESMIRRQTFLPLGKTTHFLAIATADPLNIAQAAFFRWSTGLWPEPAFAAARELIEEINAYYAGERGSDRPVRVGDHASLHTDEERAKIRGAVTQAAMADEAAAPVNSVAREQKEGETDTRPKPARPQGTNGGTTAAAKGDVRQEARRRFETEISDNVSAVQLVSSLIESAIELRTTDIHIEPAREGLVIRFRIDGELHRIMQVPAGLAQPVVSRIKVLAEMDVTERRRAQDGHFELKMEGHNFDFRIATLPAVLGEKIVIRILDTAQIKTGMEELGFLPKQRQMVDWMLARQHGMILVTGPTGSGKTSTLYAALNKLNSENRNLVTIEDPVEYQLAGVNQVQVNPDYGLSFSDGLRAILRQDPDVIMVGEIRDADTARNAVRAATTGHLVLSTLHTNSALGSIDALVQMGSAPFILAHSVLGIIAQRLIRKLCPTCRKGYLMKEEQAREFGLPEGAKGAKKRIYKAAGCDECLGSGYLGRTGAFEVIRIIEPLRVQIATHQRQEVLEQTCRQHEMYSIQQAAVEKVLAGETSAEEVIRKILLDV